jgi:hypothetical protein
MAGQNSDRDILVPALEAALVRWEEWQRGKSILGSYPPGDAILAPLSAAIEKCDVYRRVAGHSLFSGYSGVVLHAPSLALPLLLRADRAGFGPDAAADWLIRMLETRMADGVFIVVIWGLSVDREVTIANEMKLVPFDRLSHSYLKRRIEERAEFTKRQGWDQAVWLSHDFYDVPGAAIVRRVPKFPYIGSPAESFGRLAKLTAEAQAPVYFLQACGAGQPLVSGSWFEYEDKDLDFNEHENHLALSMPEIVPHIQSHVSVDPDAVARDAAALWALPSEWQDDLLRSMERFTLSQCRRLIVDQALDLAIAFEIAMRGSGQKAAVRSAQLIGGPLPRRQDNRVAIAELFNIRNKGAHGSSLKASEQRNYEAVLKDARDTYRAALACFLALGARPDWDALELEPRINT